jgi:hypothetical protein
MPEYIVSITRRVPNPDWKPPSPYSRDEPPQFLEETVTTVTLDADQWKAVQRAIVEGLK